MRSWLTNGLAALLTGAALTVTAPAAHAGDLKTDLDAILSDGRLANAKVDVLVRDARSGAELYARAADEPLLPASNRKIESSTAAFGILGPGYRFRTSVHGARSGDRIRGDLYLKGTGDPTMRAAEYDRLAAGLQAKGITKVTGDLVADDTWFDARRTAPDWDPEDFPFAYAAQISALTISPDDVFNAGSISVSVTPTAEGQPVGVALTPATNVVKVDNRAVTGRPGSPSTLAITRPNGSNTIVVSGSYPAGAARLDRLRSVEDPALYAADVFRSALKAHGITVAGTTGHGRTPARARRVVTRRSMPLSQLATPYLKLSNNIIAETLVKAIGRKVKGQGTWEAGLPLVTAYLKTLGVRTEQLRLTDGSGLGRSNLTTPRQLGVTLRAVRHKPWFRTWYNALPIAGQPDPLVGGTLATRMVNTAAAGNLHGKTGTLTGVSALSGYVKDPQGRPLIFSILVNGSTGTLDPRAIQDRIAVRLASGQDPGLAATARTRFAQPDTLECSWVAAAC